MEDVNGSAALSWVDRWLLDIYLSSRARKLGRRLRDDDGADTIVLGCAGMARHRAPLEAELGIPVIDPTQAAVAMSLSAVLCSDAFDARNT